MITAIICLVLVVVGFVGVWVAGHRHGRRAPTARVETTVEDVLILQAQQLHSPDHAARLPALVALEQHAQATPWHRAAVIETLAGYLRCPPNGDETVRRAVQRVMETHTSSGGGELYWGELDLDLDEAELTDLDLSGAVVRRLSARRALFRGNTKLNALRARDTVLITSATFEGDLSCDEMIVEHRTDLSRTNVHGALSAVGCALHGGTVLSGAAVVGSADFTDSIFFDAVAFGDPSAGPAVFQGKVCFARTRFTAARLDHVEFPGGVDLEGARFLRTPATNASAAEVLNALLRQR